MRWFWTLRTIGSLSSFSISHTYITVSWYTSKNTSLATQAPFFFFFLKIYLFIFVRVPSVSRLLPATITSWCLDVASLLLTVPALISSVCSHLAWSLSSVLSCVVYRRAGMNLLQQFNLQFVNLVCVIKRMFESLLAGSLAASWAGVCVCVCVGYGKALRIYWAWGGGGGGVSTITCQHRDMWTSCMKKATREQTLQNNKLGCINTFSSRWGVN